MELFTEAEEKHIPQSENMRVDVLSKLASTNTLGNHRSVIQETLSQPSVFLEITITSLVNTVTLGTS